MLLLSPESGDNNMKQRVGCTIVGRKERLGVAHKTPMKDFLNF